MSSPNARTTWIVISAATIAALLKLYCAWTTFGTTDVKLFAIFGKYITDHGLEATYRDWSIFNHTPLVSNFITSALALAELLFAKNCGITFPFLLRLPGIIADFLVVLILLRVPVDCKYRTAWLALFALSPVSFMVSGYHGNVDPILVLFLVLAAWMCVKNQPLACGLFLGLACNVKIAAILLAPVFFFYWLHRRQAIRLTAITIITCLAGWYEPLTEYPGLFLKNVFGYSSYWGSWGVTYWLRATGLPQFQSLVWANMAPAQHITVTILKCLVLLGILTLAWLRRATPGRGIFATIACAWAVFFIFSPGAGAQYMIWLAPFVLIASPAWYLALTIASTAFMFMFYNTISHGMPWNVGYSTNELAPIWTPWTNLPWLVLIAGASFFLWKSRNRKISPDLAENREIHG